MKLFNRSRKLPKNVNYTIDDRMSMIDKVENTPRDKDITFTPEEFSAFTGECCEYSYIRGSNIFAIVMGASMMIFGLGGEIIDRFQNRKK